MTPLRLTYPVSVAILYTTYEEDTIAKVDDLNKALTARGHIVRLFEVNKKNWRRSLRIPGDIVINLIEDDITDWKLWDKVGQKLMLMGRAQLGMSHRNLGYSLDKIKMKRKLLTLGIPTPQFRYLSRKTWNGEIRGMEYPLIAKPAEQHGSVGITQDSVVIDGQELYERVEYLFKKFSTKVLAEEYIDGREIHVTVLGDHSRAVTLPFVEIDFRGEFNDNWNIYSFNAKWKSDSWENWNAVSVCPARVSKKLWKDIDRLTRRAFKALGCCDIVRFDVRVDERTNKPFIIDLNILPGIRKNMEEECWRSARALGWSYEDFVETLVAIAYRREYGRLPNRMRERQLLLQRVS